MIHFLQYVQVEVFINTKLNFQGENTTHNNGGHAVTQNHTKSLWI